MLLLTPLVDDDVCCCGCFCCLPSDYCLLLLLYHCQQRQCGFGLIVGEGVTGESSEDRAVVVGLRMLIRHSNDVHYYYYYYCYWGNDFVMVGSTADIVVVVVVGGLFVVCFPNCSHHWGNSTMVRYAKAAAT